jgi:hypothetical protein
LSCGFFGSCIWSHGSSSLKYLNCGFLGSSIHLIWIPFSQILELWVFWIMPSFIWILFSQILELWVFRIKHSFNMDSLLSNPWIVGFWIMYSFIWILFSQILELWVFWVQAFISYGFSSLKSLNCGFFGFKHSFHMDSLLSNPWIVLLVGVLLKCCNS